jgi:hypothetical protein
MRQITREGGSAPPATCPRSREAPPSCLHQTRLAASYVGCPAHHARRTFQFSHGDVGTKMFALCEGDQIPRSVNRSILPTDEILHAQILHNQSRGRRRRRARHGRWGFDGARPEAEPSRAESRAARRESRSTPTKTCSKASRAKPETAVGGRSEAEAGAWARAQRRAEARSVIRNVK